MIIRYLFLTKNPMDFLLCFLENPVWTTKTEQNIFQYTAKSLRSLREIRLYQIADSH